MRKPRTRKFELGDRYKWNGALAEQHGVVKNLNYSHKHRYLFHAPPLPTQEEVKKSE